MLDIRVLGALNVIDGGVDVTPHGDLQRTLLAALLLEAGRPVSPDRLAEELWGEALPGNYVGALQTQVFRLRKRLASLRIERLPAGYLVDLGDHRLDVAEFESLVTNDVARDGGSMIHVEHSTCSIEPWRCGAVNRSSNSSRSRRMPGACVSRSFACGRSRSGSRSNSPGAQRLR